MDQHSTPEEKILTVGSPRHDIFLKIPPQIILVEKQYSLLLVNLMNQMLFMIQILS